MEETPPQPAINHADKQPLESAETRAAAGDAEAQFSLGLKFASDGAAQDYTQAAHWYLKAADQNHSMAQFNLSVMYARGQGVRRDDVISMDWTNRAAHLGNPGAQYNLGMKRNRVSLGEAPETAFESRIEAYKWLQLSAAQGYLGSDAGCDQVAMGMTREGVIEGRRRADAFVPGCREA